MIHLTGTNGKTSAARMTVRAARGVGPLGRHVHEPAPRGGQRAARLERRTRRRRRRSRELLSRIADIEPHLPDRPSYFEILTAAAFAWFADVAVDVAVVEVGVGGTWDATNVVDGRVAVVTNVSIDHVEYLGPTREQIATDKAGIVKPGSTLVLGETDPGSGPAVPRSRRDRCRHSRRRLRGDGESRPRMVGASPTCSRRTAGTTPCSCRSTARTRPTTRPPRLTAAECFLGRPVPEEVVADAFRTVRSPGRLEVLGHQPLVLLDGAHNVAGAHALQAALTEEFPESPRTLVIGLLREKEPHEMLEALDAKRRGAARVLPASEPARARPRRGRRRRRRRRCRPGPHRDVRHRRRRRGAEPGR